MKKVLFISGSLGLGRAVRDLAIADEMRTLNPEIDLRWLASDPAVTFLREAGETVIAEAKDYGNDNDIAEQTAHGYKLNLTKYINRCLKSWVNNAEILSRLLEKEDYDLVIGDETFEILVAVHRKRLHLQVPLVMLYDFVGLDAMTFSPIEKISAYLFNRIWAKDYRIFSHEKNQALCIGELEDIPNKRFGFLLPNRRQYAWSNYKAVGYILPFNPDDYEDKAKIRAKLGYGDEMLLIGSIGGTAVGKELLELCGQAYPIIKERIPKLRMVLVGGPRLDITSLKVPQGVEVRQYVPNLYQHFAACDLAIVPAGGTTTLELTALRRPFLYSPLEGQAEQEIAVAGRLQRHGAGVGMSFKKTTPWSLAVAIEANIGRSVKYGAVSLDGAYRTARIITRILSS